MSRRRAINDLERTLDNVVTSLRYKHCRDHAARHCEARHGMESEAIGRKLNRIGRSMRRLVCLADRHVRDQHSKKT